MAESLFTIEVANPAADFENLRNIDSANHTRIRECLDALWAIYEPYADAGFREEFARQPDSRFWEMYLACELLRAGKALRCRDQLPGAMRDRGPDIAVVEDGRVIWIEAITPDPGDGNNADRVPELFPEGADAPVRAHRAPRREVELRITNALWTKRGQFEQYQRDGIVGEADLKIVAISGSKFWGQSTGGSYSRAASAVYPIGVEFVTFSNQTGEIVDQGYNIAPEIERTNRASIPRTAFLDPMFEQIAGLIWSRRSIGNFFFQPHDFTYIHNHAGLQRLPDAWFPWSEEDIPIETDGTIELRRVVQGSNE